MLNILKNADRLGAVCLCNCGEQYQVKNRYDAKKSRIGHLCEKCKYFISKAKSINQVFLKSAFNYNKLSGELTYKVDNVLGNSNSDATIKHSAGYLTTRIKNTDYLAHRVIWFYMEGYWPNQIDHINHNKSDNSWANLREVTDKVNHQNESLSANSTTKVTGVSIIKATGKYRAYITIDRKQTHLGVFDTLDEAKFARSKANELHNFHPNHGSV